MNTWNTVILIVSLALAVGAGWWFVEWKCPTKQTKILQLSEQLEIKDDQEELAAEKLEQATPGEIKKLQKELGEEIKRLQTLNKKKESERSEEEEKELEQLPVLLEVQSLTQGVTKKEDLQSKVIGMWDYVYAGGIVLGTFVVGQTIGAYLVKQFSKED